MNNPLVTKLELCISASNLEDRDVTSKSDPVCVVLMKDSTMKYREVGRTERIENTCSPAWASSIHIDYFFEERQQIKFQVLNEI